MNMTDTKALLEEAIRQGLAEYRWWILVLAIVASSVGAFLGSYLKTKGEHKATDERFDEIRRQLKTTTKDTEEIKQYLAGEAWRSQQQWSAREQQYRDLLGHLHAFQLALSRLDDYYLEPGSEHTPDHAFGENFQHLKDRAGEAYQGISESMGVAALYLTDGTLDALEDLRIQHWGLANFESVCTADYVNDASKLAADAYERVLAEAKDQLGLGKTNRGAQPSEP